MKRIGLLLWIAALLCTLLCPAVSALVDVSPLPTVLFYTMGKGFYADGSEIYDGDCYALVWSEDGVFEGIGEDKKPLDPRDRILVMKELAADGRCRATLLILPQGTYRQEQFGLWQMDTRGADGSTGLQNTLNNAMEAENAIVSFTESGTALPVGEQALKKLLQPELYPELRLTEADCGQGFMAFTVTLADEGPICGGQDLTILIPDELTGEGVLGTVFSKGQPEITIAIVAVAVAVVTALILRGKKKAKQAEA